MEPEVERELAAVDAGLAGLTVHPDYDEIAALAVARCVCLLPTAKDSCGINSLLPSL